MATEEPEVKFAFGCYLPRELVDEVDERAADEQRSRNVMIERLLRAALDAEIST